MIQAQMKSVSLRPLGGLYTATEERLRPPNSFAKLEGFDLYVPGAIRKMRGLKEIIPGQEYESPIVAINGWRRTQADELKILGQTVTGGLYDVNTADYLAQFPASNYPFVCVMPGIASDGDIYYYISAGGGNYPYKWNGLSAPTQIGVSVPEDPIEVLFVGLVDPPFNPTTIAYDYQYIQLAVSRAYVWTYWNPDTQHESSPSPLGPNSALIAADYAQVFAQYNAITEIRLKVPTTLPAYGEGYTRKRIYATLDGGTTYYRISGQLNQDEDDSIPLEQDWFLDGAGTAGRAEFIATSQQIFEWSATGPATENTRRVWPEEESVQPDDPLGTLFAELGSSYYYPSVLIVTISPTLDTTLVDPAPLPGDNDPPPCAIWGAVYLGRLFLVDAHQQARVVFSKVGDFQSFPTDNEFVIPANDYDPITALDGQYNQLLIGKATSTHKVIGTSISDMVQVPLDPAVGIIGRRAIAPLEGRTFIFSQQGIMYYQGDVPAFFGRDIKNLTDMRVPSRMLEQCILAANCCNGIMLAAVDVIEDATLKHMLFVMDVSEQLPFSTLELPSRVWGMSNIEDLRDEQHRRAVYLGLEDRRVYSLWEGTTINGLPVSAIAITQPMPQEDIVTRKVFRWLRVEGVYDGFFYAYSVDDRDPTPFYPLTGIRNPLGVVGKLLTIYIVHTDDYDEENPPVLSNITVDYIMIGESR